MADDDPGSLLPDGPEELADSLCSASDAYRARCAELGIDAEQHLVEQTIGHGRDPNEVVLSTLLELPAEAGDSQWRSLLERSLTDDTPEHVWALCQTLVERDEYSSALGYVHSEHAPEQIVSRLASSANAGHRAHYAERGNADPTLLARLADDGDPGVRVAVAWNPSTDEVTVAKLGTDPEAAVRAKVAGRPTVEGGLLRQLAADPHVWVRTAAASNSALDAGMRQRLAEDPAEAVRAGVASNPSVDEMMLARLAWDPSRAVRHSVARNPRTPVDVLDGLSTLDDQSVRCAVAQNPSTRPATLERLVIVSGTVATFVAGNRSAPPQLLGQLAEHSDDFVRAQVARNPSTPRPVLERLMRDRETDVQSTARRRLAEV